MSVLFKLPRLQQIDTNRLMRRSITVAIAVLLLAATMTSAHAAIITVTNTNDTGPGSLRQAIAVAHDGDRITFTVSGVIRLTSGGLVVARNVTISGALAPTNSQLMAIRRNLCSESFPTELSVSPG